MDMAASLPQSQTKSPPSPPPPPLSWVDSIDPKGSGTGTGTGTGTGAGAGAGAGPYTTLCLSGGGVCGVAYLGALKMLHRCGAADWLSDARPIQTFIGTSVGALFALLTCAKVDLFMPDITTTVRTFLRLFQWNTTNLFRGARFGLGTGAECVAFIDGLLKTRYGRANLTLAQLHGLVGGQLILVSSCVKTSQPICFSHHSHPHVRVADAAFASMAIPFLFEPHKIRVREEDVVFPFAKAYGPALHVGQTFDYGGKEFEVQQVDRDSCRLRAAKYGVQHCVDGCLVANNPFMMAPAGSRILNLQLHNPSRFDVRNQTLFPYITRVLSISIRRVEALCEQAFAHLDRDTICIDTADAAGTNFQMQDLELRDLLRRGSVAVQDFYQQRHPETDPSQPIAAAQPVAAAQPAAATTDPSQSAAVFIPPAAPAQRHADEDLRRVLCRWEQHLTGGAAPSGPREHAGARDLGPFTREPLIHGAPTIQPVAVPMNQKVDIAALQKEAEQAMYACGSARSLSRSPDSSRSDDDDDDDRSSDTNNSDDGSDTNNSDDGSDAR